jgi:hypothetical protein
MKIGNRVVVVSIPAELPSGMGTQELFEKCLGRTFPIVGFNDYGLVELEVGHVVGEPPYMHSIWIEPSHLALVDAKAGNP